MNSQIRSVENQQEFTAATEASTHLRWALSPYLRSVGIKFIGNLNKHMLEVVKLDDVHPRGMRVVLRSKAKALGNKSLFDNGIQGFVFRPFISEIVETTGKLVGRISFEKAISPALDIKPMKGADKFQLSCILCAINFADPSVAPRMKATDQLFSLSAATSAVVKIETPEMTGLTADFTRFLIVYTTYLQTVNNLDYPLNTANMQSMNIVLAL